MKPNYRTAASAGLLVTAACANLAPAATTVQTVVGPQATSSGFDVLFSSVASVEDLVSISDGSVYTGEGASFKISAILTNDQVVEIFSHFPLNPFETISLSTLTGNAFTDFATPQDIKGLRFTASGGNPNQPGTFTLPGSTVLTFAVVPEPTAAVIMLSGVISLAAHRRRKQD